MSDQPQGLMATLSKLGSSIVVSLGPQYLALILMNIMFMGLLIWFVDKRAQHTSAIMQQLLDTCLQQAR